MDLEQLLTDFAEDLDGLIDVKNILSNRNTHSSFTSYLLKIRPTLPKSIQQLLQKNLKWLKCNKCWNSAISEFFDCGHGFCSYCITNFHTPNQCLCGYEILSSENQTIDPHLCKRCLKVINFIDGNCLDFCYNCVVELVNNNNKSQCPVCLKQFYIYERKGNCSACRIYSSLYLLCTNQHHYHCFDCSLKDLKNLKCEQCSFALIPMSVAIFYCKAYPVCGHCNSRNFYWNSSYLSCCGSYYCFVCLSGCVNTLCFCGKIMDKTVINIPKQIVNGIDIMNQAFELFCAGV